jgi:hypothetical protein
MRAAACSCLKKLQLLTSCLYACHRDQLHNAASSAASKRSSSSSSSSSAAANAAHRRRGRKGKSVYRGVCVTREGKWRAVIYKERKQLYLGVFESEVDAAKAHDRAARQHFGAQAMVNFLNDDESDTMQHVMPPHSGSISPMHSSAKMAKAAPGLFHNGKPEPLAALDSEDSSYNSSDDSLDFAFPFSEDPYVTDQLGLFTFDIRDSDAAPSPLLDPVSSEPFGSLFFGSNSELGDLCLV